MLLDWFTVIAQIINFLVLIALLNHFLFKPILAKVDQRKKEQEEKERNVEEKVKEAEEMKVEYEEKLSTIDQHKRKVLDEAHDTAELERNKMISEARKEVSEKKALWLEEFEKSKEAQKDRVSKKLEGTIFSVTKRLLKEFADQDLQEKMVEVFLKRLEEVEKKELPKTPETITVISEFELSTAWKRKVTTKVHEVFGESELRYVHDPKFLSGLKLEAGSFQLFWSPYHYLEEVERTLESSDEF